MTATTLDQPIVDEDVAADNGDDWLWYASEKAFSRAFKRAFGINPSKYREAGSPKPECIEANRHA